MIRVIPKPNCIVEGNGVYHFNSCLVKNEFEKNNKFINECLKEYSIQNGDKENLVFSMDSSLDKEEYSLSVNENGVKIVASTEVGAFYGLQTLKQMLNDSLDLPYVDIKDKPRFSYRSFMMDEARHFFGMNVIKEMLDMMALLKLNRFHWHLTDDQGWRVEIKKYPLLTEKGTSRKSTTIAWKESTARTTPIRDGKEYGKGCFYTQEQLKEIVAYAKERYIEICPEIDMPGHLVAAIACYPELSCFNEQIDVSENWGIMDTIGCCGKEPLYTFVKDVIKELTEVFPAEYFHIGGDEVPKTKWKKCPDCQKKIKELGLKNEHELQGYFNNEIMEYLESFGKRTIAWNEILDADGVSDKTIVQFWVGNPKLNGVNKWLEKGNNIIVSKCNNLYMDYYYAMEDIKKSYNTDISSSGLGKKYEKQVLGFEAPLWSEYVSSKEKLEFQVFPRLMSLAEINWTTPENKNFKSFMDRLDNINTILDEKSINYARKEECYPTGFDGLKRRIKWGAEWCSKPLLEYDRCMENRKN